jgi:hypothetical protein
VRATQFFAAPSVAAAFDAAAPDAGAREAATPDAAAAFGVATTAFEDGLRAVAASVSKGG